MDEHLSVEEALSREVIRKLKLAAEAETKDDREIICEELFCDITGTLDTHAQERLGFPALSEEASTSSPVPLRVPGTRGKKAPVIRAVAPSRPTFYEVLARFYQNARDSGEAVAHLCQRLWGQGYAAPIFALLLHRWLLLGRGAASLGGAMARRDSHANVEGLGREAPAPNASPTPAPHSTLPGWRALSAQLQLPHQQQQQQQQQQHLHQPHRVKQVSVLVLGAKQLFLGDVHSGEMRFHAMFRCLMEEVVVGPGMALLARLPLSTRTDLLAAVAAVLPYYSDPRRMHDLIACLPSPTATVVVRTVEEEAEEESEQPVQGQGQGHRPSSPGLMWSSPPGAGADFLIGEVSDTLGKIRSEAGLLQYLLALHALKGSPHLRTLHHITSLRLQSELYSLTSPGGPHYAPQPVRVAAMQTLDALYPMGRRTRRIVRAIFRLLHPTDWLGEFWLAPLHWWAWLYTRVLVSTFWFIYSLIWRPQPSTQRGSKRR